MLQLVEFNFIPANNSRKQPEQFTIIVNSINEIEKNSEGEVAVTELEQLIQQGLENA